MIRNLICTTCFAVAAIAQPTPTPLPQLLEEAAHNNRDILAALHGWRAAAQVPTQVSTLPDPEVTVQQFSVGSPRPFAGFSNSDFAYIGIGISQDLPYPGKLGLRGEVAQRDAAASRKQFEGAQRRIRAEVKAAYYQLSYLQRTLALIQRDGKLLDEIEKIAEARYRTGQGSQQDVLKSQLQRTQLLGELAHHHAAIEMTQAKLNRLLNRPPDSPAITADELTETSLPYTSQELLARVRTENPAVELEQEMVRKQSLQVELARKDFYPDFNVQYMWQHTAGQFRDYYMLSFGAKIPLYRRRRLDPELTEAVEELDRSRRTYESEVQQAYFEVRDQFIAADTAAQLLKIYREGSIPQAMATYQAGLASYESGKQDFETLLSAFLDVLHYDEEYWKTLAGHEAALARIERLTGVTLP
ncbi:MAG TPA: TolC family protein [Bryobacteraceae bacterium]|nr:TolC family protein [Bryobacteraceae bacterium]